MTFDCRATMIGLLFLFMGCASWDPPPPPPLDAASLENLNQTYPPSFTMVHRVALTVRGKQYDFIGYLRMDRPAGAFRALASGEMGGKLFDIRQRPGAAPEILKKPEPMPLEPLLQGIARDLTHLFGEFPSSDDARYIFSGDGSRISDSSEHEGHRLARSAIYSDYRAFTGWSRPLPARIVLENHRWHYRMEIELLEIKPIVPGALP